MFQHGLSQQKFSWTEPTLQNLYEGGKGLLQFINHQLLKHKTPTSKHRPMCPIAEVFVASGQSTFPRTSTY